MSMSQSVVSDEHGIGIILGGEYVSPLLNDPTFLGLLPPTFFGNNSDPIFSHLGP